MLPGDNDGKLQPSRGPGATVAHLVDALHDMRNALVKASLMLQDFQFDADSEQRIVAIEHSKELLKKIKPR